MIYQVYPRSFKDSNGDGMGDLGGITEKLDHLGYLGVDAVWLSPFYLSPQNDAGYDVADYRAVDPRFGTLEDFDRMCAKAHALGLRLIVDLVPNHTSEDHAWFRAALAAGPGSPERARYMFREGGGEHGETPPNNWKSLFGGPAWSRVPDGQWYLHLFDSSQPDLNWESPEVWEEFRAVLRFWLDRGVDGFRVDVAHGMIKARGLPDWDEQVHMVEGTEAPADPGGPAERTMDTGPYFDQDGVHEIYRDWNRVLAGYPGERMLVVEAWIGPPERLARYVRADEAQQAFNFDFLVAGWHRDRMRDAIGAALEVNAAVGAPSTTHVPSTYTRKSGSTVRWARSSQRQRTRPSTECTNRAATGWATATASSATPMNATRRMLFSSRTGAEKSASSTRVASAGSREKNASHPASCTRAAVTGTETATVRAVSAASTMPSEPSGCHQRARGVRISSG